jgi:predicted lactoylglutathione lyase
MVVGIFAYAKANSQQISATASITLILNQHSAILVVEQFFKNFHKQDTAALRKHLVDLASLMSLFI